MQWGSSTIKSELFFVERKINSSQYMVFKLIYLSTLVHTYEFVYTRLANTLAAELYDVTASCFDIYIVALRFLLFLLPNSLKNPAKLNVRSI
jgi:hypothetical protein